MLSSPILGWGVRWAQLTQCRLGRGLPPYQVELDPTSRLAATEMGRKLGAVPFGRGSWVPIEHNVAAAEAYLRAKFRPGPSNRLPQYTNVTNRQTRQTDRQRAESIGRTVLQTVAQKFASR